MNKQQRMQLKAQYSELWNIIANAVIAADPIGLIRMGAPSDEYEPEVGTILPPLLSVSSEKECFIIIYQEFLRWFDASVVGHASVYENIAKEVWEKYHNTLKSV